MSLQNLLAQLNEIFERLGRVDNLEEPLTTKEVAALSESLPFELPDDLKSLYEWHNGILGFIPAFDFLSLSEAFTEYQQLIEMAEDFWYEDDFFKTTYFPILQHQDSWLMLNCEPNSETASIYYVWLENGSTFKEYENLEQFFKVTVDAYLSRAYYIEDDWLQGNPVLFQKIKNKYLSPEQRQERESIWEKLCSEVNSPLGFTSEYNKQDIIRRLRETCDERAIEYLRHFLRDRNPEVVAQAAFTLGQLKARETLPELLQLLKHPVTGVRNLSVCAIGDIVTPDDELVVQPVMNLLADRETIVRLNAVRTLGQLRSQQAVSPLMNLLQARNQWVMNVIQALGKIGDTRAIGALQRLRNEIVSGSAIRAIDEAISRIERVNS